MNHDAKEQDSQREGEAPAQLRLDREAELRWLADHWDTRVRNAALDDDKWKYVLTNPVRARPVARLGRLAYQGKIFALSWR